MQTPSSTLNATIRAEMARRGVNQTQLAQLIGLSQASFSRRLSGQADWTVNELAAVAAALDVPMSALLPADDTKASA